MGPEEILQFLITEQKETDISLTQCNRIVLKYAESSTGQMAFPGFIWWMLSKEEDIFDVKHNQVCQDMTLPLTDYFVASSHNTYLLGDQLIGSSSIEAYIRVLEQGCRCIELDVWDGDNDEPIIYHGYTLTSKILLYDVLEAIRNHAFKTSSYPLILSIENHLSVEQQVAMATYFECILGDYLYKEPVADDETQWPSPEQLKEKIIIKSKKLAEEYGEKEQREEERKRLKEAEREQTLAAAMASLHVTDSSRNLLPSPLKYKKIVNQKDYSDDGALKDDVRLDDDVDVLIPSPISNDDEQGYVDVSSDVPDIADISLKSKNSKIASELSDLINYCRSRKFESFDDCLSNWDFCDMASFAEQKGLKLSVNERSRFLNYNRRHLARIYPDGFRFNSSNYNPLPFWLVGCQLVAINYQTYDDAMVLNDALFIQNGACGYVLKPESMRSKKSPNMAAILPTPLRLTIRVISGQHLPKKPDVDDVISPLVNITIIGDPEDEISLNTFAVKDNGFNPQWNEGFTFIIEQPDLAFIEFSVRDEGKSGKTTKLASRTLPVSAVRQGYRHVHLRDLNGNELNAASIFLHISI
ncbi:1-phosphatidylinositol 4,5-bisphosphate phosphodiesterase zeta-1 [Halotydeus destructor]|nr:1-phosphatidylinositol 4,5-bisphosphate phosphodiesterase zeta-1 [Halotydeus destructor]